jgi:hypothetical protein
LRASKGKQLFSEVTLSVLKILPMAGLCPISLVVLWTLISTWNSLTFVKNLSKINMKQARPWMLANLKIIWQFHAHPVHQKVSRFFGPNLVSFNRTVVPYEISKVNFRVRAPDNFQVQKVITPYFWKWCAFAYFLCTVVLSTSEKIAYMYTFKIMFDTSVIR